MANLEYFKDGSIVVPYEMCVCGKKKLQLAIDDNGLYFCTCDENLIGSQKTDPHYETRLYFWNKINNE